MSDCSNLGIVGYESIELNGKVIIGNGCIAITKDNVDNFPF